MNSIGLLLQPVPTYRDRTLVRLVILLIKLITLEYKICHMKRLFVPFLLLFAISLNAQKTLQERLGYSKDAKLLILHADDLGMSHSVDAATVYGMEHGSISSASIMMPTPWIA